MYSQAQAREKPMSDNWIPNTDTPLKAPPFKVIDCAPGYKPQVEDPGFQAVVSILKEKAARREKPKIPTHFNGKLIVDLTSAEKAEFYISMQQPSTQMCLKRDPKDDEAWRNRPMPENWKAVPDADFSTPEGRDKAVAKRTLDPNDIAIVQQNRHSESRNSLGQSDLSSVSPEKRTKGIEAFTYSKPAELTPEQVKKVTKMEDIKSTPLEPVKPQKRSLFYRAWRKLGRIINPTVADLYDND